MAKKFGGFTEQQKEVLARKMGFNGPMDKFGEFLTSSPSHAQQFVKYETKAKQLVQSAPLAKPLAAFAKGGTVDETTTTGTNPFGDVNTISKNLEGSTGTSLTNQLLTTPEAAITPVAVKKIDVTPDQTISTTSGQVETKPDLTAATVGATEQVNAPEPVVTKTVDTASSAPQVEAATQDMKASTGTVSDKAQVEAATALPSSDATIQGQLENLMKQFEGKEPPAWAAGAIRNANAVMGQRGLGASSMAGMAVTQAAMESAIQIAAQDASTFSSFEMQNLNNRQQARVTNAQSFLQMDLQNLSNEQQMNVVKSQSIIQSLFNDTAAENASRQFNATSENQTEQFFASLKTQVSTFNATQKNAMTQFDTEQTNAVTMFNRQMNDARDQFNAQNRLVIDQSNAEWRRAVTTADTAAINEANRVNAQNATAMTTAAYNNVMQRERDLYSFAFTSSENAKQRAADLTMAKYNGSVSSKNSTGEALGNVAGALIGGIFGNRG